MDPLNCNRKVFFLGKSFIRNKLNGYSSKDSKQAFLIFISQSIQLIWLLKNRVKLKPRNIDGSSKNSSLGHICLLTRMSRVRFLSFSTGIIISVSVYTEIKTGTLTGFRLFLKDSFHFWRKETLSIKMIFFFFSRPSLLISFIRRENRSLPFM